MIRLSLTLAAVVAASTACAATPAPATQQISINVSQVVLNSGSLTGDFNKARFKYFNRNTYDTIANFFFVGPVVGSPALPPFALAGDGSSRYDLIGQGDPFSDHLVGYGAGNLVLKLSYALPGKTSTAPNLKEALVVSASVSPDPSDSSFSIATFNYVANWPSAITYPVTAQVNSVQLLGGTSAVELTPKPEIFTFGTHNNAFQVRFSNDATVSWSVDNNIVIVNAVNPPFIIN